MDYEISRLSESLVYIRWLQTPSLNSASERQYLVDVTKLLDEASTPQYFVSDLRYGRIVTVTILRRLGGLTKHANWGGSTAFSSNPVTSIMVGFFSRFAHKERPQDEIWNTPEEALAYLESIQPNITADLDWNAILDSTSTGA
jgi:hypothetical protein